MVTAAFAGFPSDLVHNPDGDPGISLHIELDETNIPRHAWAGDLDGDGQTALEGDEDDLGGGPWFSQIAANRSDHPGGFGRLDQRRPTENDNSENVLAAKSLVYRYAVFADEFAFKDEDDVIRIVNSGAGCGR